MVTTNTSIPEVEYKIYAKKFLVFLINKIGKEHWLRRKKILKAEIRYIESNISMVKGPIEEQMFMAPTKSDGSVTTISACLISTSLALFKSVRGPAPWYNSAFMVRKLNVVSTRFFWR